MLNEKLEWVRERPYLATIGLVGIFLVVVGVISVVAISSKIGGDGVEIVEIEKEEDSGEIFVDVGGAVEEPGMYKLEAKARINDALVKAEGLSAEADRDWFEKNINLAAKLTDGMKIYIPARSETSGSTNFQAPNPPAGETGFKQTGEVSGVSIEDKVNVNTASSAELDKLWGIGPVTAEKVIGGRPYGSVEELLTKKILKSNVYERNKDKLAVY